eukprot:CAMPEP_0167766360 /NCGR_PEP_ID=MMETSP0110_2-20121227/15301_1 /TAXON_ID=629695 /ORGANISM="Gymnochlora sp., Strain CCMP2014" /LENGTH=157 /DNA_ID=CAMNT_0007654379 /DNA_START=380 /DNA_END=856 /DNA_ORIENTATION=-
MACAAAKGEEKGFMGTKYAVDSVDDVKFLPKLVVFDLDNTVWTPELYELYRMPEYGKDIKLFPAAKAALVELVKNPKWKGTKVAAASRTTCVDWAYKLMKKVEIVDGKTMADIFSFTEIYPTTKLKHFRALLKDSGIEYDDMIFFDDGRYNTDEIEE